MKIINNNNILTNKQINKIIYLLGKEYKLKIIVIYETRTDVIKRIIFYPEILFFMVQILIGKLEGLYVPFIDRINIFIFSENDDGDNFHSKQLYSLHALLHELRHKYQYETNKKMSEEDADSFATKFINNNSKKLKEIMNWKDEWFIEEE